ncbi:MAG: hypothetical protein IJY78_06400 [Bacteroidaceae bacterium]|nr:hypothetical protein [Bacteroidaceae bacterium]
MINIKYKVHPSYKQTESFVKSLPVIFSSEGAIIYEKRNVVKSFTIKEECLIVKQYKKPNIIQRISYSFFRPSKAKRAYNYAIQLLDMGISTPFPVAFLEIYKNGFFKQGYFVSTTDNRPSCKDIESEKPESQHLTDALAGFIVSMHEKGFLHGDLNLSNILYSLEGNNQYNFSIIDTNRSHFINNPSKKLCYKNMMRISHKRSLIKNIVSKYAELRKWPIDDSVNAVLGYLSSFERKRKIIWMLKRLK